MTEGEYRLNVSLDSQSRSRLFHLTEDPGEERDLAKTEPERVAALRTCIKSIRANPSSWTEAYEIELDPTRLRRLRAVGYIRIDAPDR